MIVVPRQPLAQRSVDRIGGPLRVPVVVEQDIVERLPIDRPADIRIAADDADPRRIAARIEHRLGGIHDGAAPGQAGHDPGRVKRDRVERGSVRRHRSGQTVGRRVPQVVRYERAHEDAQAQHGGADEAGPRAPPGQRHPQPHRGERRQEVHGGEIVITVQQGGLGRAQEQQQPRGAPKADSPQPAAPAHRCERTVHTQDEDEGEEMRSDRQRQLEERLGRGAHIPVAVVEGLDRPARAESIENPGRAGQGGEDDKAGGHRHSAEGPARARRPPQTEERGVEQRGRELEPDRERDPGPRANQLPPPPAIDVPQQRRRAGQGAADAGGVELGVLRVVDGPRDGRDEARGDQRDLFAAEEPPDHRGRQGDRGDPEHDDRQARGPLARAEEPESRPHQPGDPRSEGVIQPQFVVLGEQAVPVEVQRDQGVMAFVPRVGANAVEGTGDMREPQQRPQGRDQREPPSVHPRRKVLPLPWSGRRGARATNRHERGYSPSLTRAKRRRPTWTSSPSRTSTSRSSWTRARSRLTPPWLISRRASVLESARPVSTSRRARRIRPPRRRSRPSVTSGISSGSSRDPKTRSNSASAARAAASSWYRRVISRANPRLASRGCARPEPSAASSARISSSGTCVQYSKYGIISGSGSDITLPYISLGGSVMPIALPRLLLIFWTPSSPGSSGVSTTT